jgi:REP element-mobilizing transposase RayT
LRFGGQLRAYVLMSNHVHLLLMPNEVGAVSRLIELWGQCGWSYRVLQLDEALCERHFCAKLTP